MVLNGCSNCEGKRDFLRGLWSRSIISVLIHVVIVIVRVIVRLILVLFFGVIFAVVHVSGISCVSIVDVRISVRIILIGWELRVTEILKTLNLIWIVVFLVLAVLVVLGGILIFCVVEIGGLLDLSRRNVPSVSVMSVHVKTALCGWAVAKVHGAAWVEVLPTTTSTSTTTTCCVATSAAVTSWTWTGAGCDGTVRCSGWRAELVETLLLWLVTRDVRRGRVRLTSLLIRIVTTLVWALGLLLGTLRACVGVVTQAFLFEELHETIKSDSGVVKTETGSVPLKLPVVEHEAIVGVLNGEGVW
jgi:hypothetical protein